MVTNIFLVLTPEVNRQIHADSARVATINLHDIQLQPTQGNGACIKSSRNAYNVR